MTRPLRVVVVNGSPSTSSKTVALADLVTDTLADSLPLDLHRVDAGRSDRA